MKRETMEDVIRMATRVQIRMRREGIALHFTVQMEPCEPWKSEKDCAGSMLKRGKKKMAGEP